MTIHELTSSLFGISLGHFFNGEKWSRQELEHYIVNQFRPGTSLKLKNGFLMEICLPDGRWLTQVFRYSDKPDGFDYFIPDNREQEDRLWKALTE